MMATERTPPKNAPAQIAMVSASRPTGTWRIELSFETRRISVLTQSSGKACGQPHAGFDQLGVDLIVDVHREAVRFFWK